MIFGILVMLTALTISAVAIYYSVAGLAAIFAAAVIPIIIMGGVLEVAKLVTAVWLHKYWTQAKWWLKYYLAMAVVVLMLITSMGIFGFLSKAHIEQTSAGEESVAQITQIDNEVTRLTSVITRAESKIKQLETSGTGSDANIQSQIDKEQVRIDKAFNRIKPAIEQQNLIITNARAGDSNRTKPYEDQLSSITAEILRLEASAKQYEQSIANLTVNNSATQPLLDQIASITATITKVEGQIASNEREQIKQAQATIGANADGSAGPNTRRSANAWIETQKVNINDINEQISKIRLEGKSTIDIERQRLADVVKDIRTTLIPALKARELIMLGKIDEVRQTESPVIATARDEIQRLRESAEAQVVNSQSLIERLRSQLAQTDKADEIDSAVDEQLARIKTAESEVDVLTNKKYGLEAEYRMLEAEVGPIKYIAEFVYGEAADRNMLEEAVRWVIITIIFVFDPLAVLLLIASQYTFQFIKRAKQEDFDYAKYEKTRAQAIVNNQAERYEDVDQETLDSEFDHEFVGLEDDIKYEDISDEEQQKELDDQDEYIRSLIEDEQTPPPPTDDLDHLIEEEINKINEEVTNEALAVAEEYKEELKPEVTPNLNNNSNMGIVVEAARLTEEEIAALDSRPDWNEAKRKWKDEHPNLTIKSFKEKYLAGEIDSFPWETYLEESVSSDSNETTVDSGYIQNEEQTNDTQWRMVRDKDV